MATPLPRSARIAVVVWQYATDPYAGVHVTTKYFGDGDQAAKFVSCQRERGFLTESISRPTDDR